MTGNQRLWQAIASVRIDRNPATMSELYDARNARANRRNVRLTHEELEKLRVDYLTANAPDLLHVRD